MSGSRSSTGLVCGHGSDLDMRIPRAKCPKSALPDSVRRSMGLKPRADRKRDQRLGKANLPTAHDNAGAGVLKPRESKDGKYAAGCQKNFLRRGSGQAMSSRASKLAQNNMKVRKRTNSTPTQAKANNNRNRTNERRSTDEGRAEARKIGGSRRKEPAVSEVSREEQRDELRRKRAVAARQRQLNKE